MSKTILSVLALAGDKAAAATVAAADIHAAIFHLCHAGQGTPLKDTFEALPNRGKAAKIRAVVSDYWQAAAAYRAAVKNDGKLDKSGRFVGLQADNIPFAKADILADLLDAVATVKKEKAAADESDEAAAAKAAAAAATLEGEKPQDAIIRLAAENQGMRKDGLGLTAENDRLRADNEALRAKNEALRADNEALRAELTAMLAAAVAVPKGRSKKAAAVAVA